MKVSPERICTKNSLNVSNATAANGIRSTNLYASIFLVPQNQLKLIRTSIIVSVIVDRHPDFLIDFILNSPK